MKGFEASAEIEAAPEIVWGKLTNAAALASGGLGITRIEGEIRPQSRFKLWTEATGARAFALQVTLSDAPRRMIWQGGMPLGLFAGTRVFTLAPAGSGTSFSMREDYSGLLAALITRTIPDLTPSFERFASGLKKLAETR